MTTDFLAQPKMLSILTVAIAGWVAANLTLYLQGVHALDMPPFPYLADAASIVALYLTTIVLITQRHDDDLATRRDQLTLELAILADQKASKIISLLEDIRRQDPNRGSGRDGEAEALSETVHPHQTLNALQAAHGAIESGREG